MPSGSLNARLATLERSLSIAHKTAPSARQSTSIAASSSVVASLSPPTGLDDSAASSPAPDLADRVAALEARLSGLRQIESPQGLRSSRSAGVGSSPSSAGTASAQLLQSDSALKEQMSQLQQQIEALVSGKANKADVEALQLHAAVLGSGSSVSAAGGSGGSSGSIGSNDKSGSHSVAATAGETSAAERTGASGAGTVSTCTSWACMLATMPCLPVYSYSDTCPGTGTQSHKT